jgi:S-formylglutathione hydrolase FrmB
VTIDTPSRYVDVKTAVFNGPPPSVLRANVLLPDGYDADSTRRWPVLYLLHGVGDSYDTWAKPDRGDIMSTAKGFPGIIVMPEGGKGFYTNWFNGGKRADPAWESYFLTELIPQVARRFRVAPGRRHHAIAGLSMGGMGATYLGSQRPDYFGTVATFSGFVEHQRETVQAGFGAVAGVDYEAIFGPIDGEYASGHNPTKLVGNLTNTPVFDASGNGVPEPGVEGSPSAIAGGGVVEAEIGQENQEFAAAARAAGVQLDYRPGLGVHDWPYWRRYLGEAIQWGLFRDGVVEHPVRWSYSTIATSGRMWSLRYAFAEPPAQVARFERDGDVLRGAGKGRVAITDIASGCGFEAPLPFRRTLPPAAGDPTCGRLRVRVSPRRFRAGRTARLRVRVTRAVDGAGELPVAGAVVRVGRSMARTSAGGLAILRHRFAGYAGVRHVRVSAPGLGRVLVGLRSRG